jgi:hypothetical protein
MSEQRNVQLIEQTSKTIKAWMLVGVVVCLLGPLLGLVVRDAGTAILLEVIGLTLVIGAGIAAFWNHG